MGMLGAWAVSYTHLDVYKRQVRLILIDQDPIALAAAEQFAIQMGLENDIEIHCKQLFKGNGRKTRVLNIDEEVLHGRKTVSYTHLDVYKRQVY